MRILIVEDDPLIREFTVEALRDEGFEVIQATDGEEALALCKRQVADVLVTDIRLPGEVDGWQVAERCREHDPGLPVIYATGFSPVVARPVPGSLSLQKPYHPEEILRREVGLARIKGRHPRPPLFEPRAKSRGLRSVRQISASSDMSRHTSSLAQQVREAHLDVGQSLSEIDA